MSSPESSAANTTNGLPTSNASKHLRIDFDILKLPLVLHNPLIRYRVVRHATSLWYEELVLVTYVLMSVNCASV